MKEDKLLLDILPYSVSLFTTCSVIFQRIIEREVATVIRDELAGLEAFQDEFTETMRFFLDSYNVVLETIKRVKRIHFNLKKL